MYIKPGFRRLDKDSQRVATFVILSVSAVFCVINLLINETKDQLVYSSQSYHPCTIVL